MRLGWVAQKSALVTTPNQLMDRFDVRMLLPQLKDRQRDGQSCWLDPTHNFARYRALVVAHGGTECVPQARVALLRRTGMTPTQEALATTPEAPRATVDVESDECVALAARYGITDWVRHVLGLAEPSSDDDGSDHGDDDGFVRVREREFPSYGSADADARAHAEAPPLATHGAKMEDEQEEKEDEVPLELLGPRERMARLLQQQLTGTASRLEPQRAQAAHFDLDAAVQRSQVDALKRPRSDDDKKQRKAAKKEKKRAKKEKKHVTKLKLKGQ